MSLNWNLEDIENYDDVCFIKSEPKPGEEKYAKEDGLVRTLAPLTEALIFATMGVKIGRITEDNAAEFYARVKLQEQVWGPLTYKMEDGKKVDQYVTPEQIQAHIGLSCNVIDESRAAFLKFIKRDMDDSVRHYKSKVKEAATA